MLNFAVNGRQVGGRVLEPNLLGGEGGWPVHPAVCLQVRYLTTLVCPRQTPPMRPLIFLTGFLFGPASGRGRLRGAEGAALEHLALSAQCIWPVP